MKYRSAFPWPVPIKAQQSIQLRNPSFRQNTGSCWVSAQPSPGAANAVDGAAGEEPPAIDQPLDALDYAGNRAVLSVRVRPRDAAQAIGVVIQLQHVQPGAFVRRTDAAFATRWSDVAARDDGLEASSGDRVAGDNIYAISVPASMLQHRSLVRWRVQVTYGGGGARLTAPYANDVPNFAFFWYTGVPAYTAAIDPSGAGGDSSTQTIDFSQAEEMPVVHVLAVESDVYDALWMYKSRLNEGDYSGEYKWHAALVVDGEVYDHVRFRSRGQRGRFAYGKNGWKFRFNDSKRLVLRRDGGKHKPVPGARLTHLALDPMFLNMMSGWQRQYEPLGTHGLPQLVSRRMFDLHDVPVGFYSLLHLRVVLRNAERVSQYESDFWGFFLTLEEPGDQFLDRHNLPDGNLIKAAKPPDPYSLKHRGVGQPGDFSDVEALVGRLLAGNQNRAWVDANVDLDNYYRYQTAVTAIGHLDIGFEKNWLYYRASEGDRRWKVLPWDLDRTFVPTVFANDLFTQVLRFTDTRTQLSMALAEHAQLVCDNGNELRRILDEQARRVYNPSKRQHWIDAERRRWDWSPELERAPNQNHPFQRSRSGERRPAPKGMFYVRANTVTGSLGRALANDLTTVYEIARGNTQLYTGTFAKMVDPYMSRMLEWHCDRVRDRVDNNFRPPAALAAPVLVAGAAVDSLAFRVVVPSSADTVEWRMAELYGPQVTPSSYVDGDAYRFELQARRSATFAAARGGDWKLPIDMRLVERRVRVRARQRNSDGVAGAWSPPLEFVASAPAHAAPPLVVSEVMYHAAGGAQHDYIELYNGGSVARELAGIELDGDVRFEFVDGDTLAARATLVLAADAAAFAAHYAQQPFNAAPERALRGSLSNSGATYELKDAGGRVMDRVAIETRLPFDSPLADGFGAALERINAARPAELPLWAPSVAGGTPGRHSDRPAAAPLLVVSEVMASPLDGVSDWVELQNVGAETLDLRGWFVTDSLDKPTRKPLSGTLDAGQFLVLTRGELGFGFATRGEACYVLRADTAGVPSGALHGFAFESVEPGRTIGRHVSADGREHLGVPLSAASPGFANAYPAASPLAITALAIDLAEHRRNDDMQTSREFEGAEPSRRAYVELKSTSGAPVKLSEAGGAEERWCLRGCRYRFCFDGNQRGAHAIVAEAHVHRFVRPASVAAAAAGGAIVLAGGALDGDSGLPSDNNKNAWTLTPGDPCTSGGADTRMRLERHRVNVSESGELEELQETREFVDLLALQSLGLAPLPIGLEERGPVRLERVSPLAFAGDVASWSAVAIDAAPGSGAPECGAGGAVDACPALSTCVVATGCDANNRCVYGELQCDEPRTACHVSYCNAAQGCVEELIDYTLAGGLALPAFCALDPDAGAMCGNSVIEDGEVCDGELCCAPDCLSVLPALTECRARNPELGCDVGAYCDGKSATCGSNSVAGAGTVCRPADPALPCDAEELCSGTSAFCPDDASSAVKAPCTPLAPLDACRGDARCVNSGQCHALYTCDCSADASLCDTNDACWVGSCAAGSCVRAEAPQGTPCSDNNACTSNDACDGQGACVGQSGTCIENCSGHGRCCASVCECEPGWIGDACAQQSDQGSDRAPGGFDWQFWAMVAAIALGSVCCLTLFCCCVTRTRRKRRDRIELQRMATFDAAEPAYDPNDVAGNMIGVGMAGDTPKSAVEPSGFYGDISQARNLHQSSAPVAPPLVVHHPQQQQQQQQQQSQRPPQHMGPRTANPLAFSAPIPARNSPAPMPAPPSARAPPLQSVMSQQTFTRPPPQRRPFPPLNHSVTQARFAPMPQRAMPSAPDPMKRAMPTINPKSRPMPQINNMPNNNQQMPATNGPPTARANNQLAAKARPLPSAQPNQSSLPQTQTIVDQKTYAEMPFVKSSALY